MKHHRHLVLLTYHLKWPTSLGVEGVPPLEWEGVPPLGWVGAAGWEGVPALGWVGGRVGSSICGVDKINEGGALGGWLQVASCHEVIDLNVCLDFKGSVIVCL